jgi:hypothetical protein
MIDIRGAIGHLRPPPGFRSCRLNVFRHPELITGQTIKARHLCLMSKNTETGVTRLRFGERFRDCLFSMLAGQSSFARSFYTTTTPNRRDYISRHPADRHSIHDERRHPMARPWAWCLRPHDAHPRDYPRLGYYRQAAPSPVSRAAWRCCSLCARATFWQVKCCSKHIQAE